MLRDRLRPVTAFSLIGSGSQDIGDVHELWVVHRANVNARLSHRQSGVLQDPGLLRFRGRMPAPGNGPKIALKGLHSVYSLTKMFKRNLGGGRTRGSCPLFGGTSKCSATLRCSNGSNRRPWNATHRTHQRTDTHVHDSRRHPSICRGAYHGQDRVEDTPP